MNFQQLEYFKLVYEMGNMTRAAELLQLSQPAVSSAIRELEAELGVPLFIRKNRGLLPSKEGDFFYPQANRLLRQKERLKVQVREVGEQKQKIRLGMAPMIGNLVFSPIYRRLSQLCPEVELEIVEAGSTELKQRLETEGLDLIMAPIMIEEEGYVNQPLFQSKIVLAVSIDHPLATKEHLEAEDLTNVPLAFYRKGYIQYQHIERLFAKHGFEAKVINRSSNYMTICSLIECGVACGFLIKEVCEGNERIKTFDFKDFDPFAAYLIWKDDTYLSFASQQFIRCCQENKGSLLTNKPVCDI